jgi:hypothetical protein
MVEGFGNVFIQYLSYFLVYDYHTPDCVFSAAHGIPGYSLTPDGSRSPCAKGLRRHR